MSDTIAGPRLPPWEADTLGWMRYVFNRAGGRISAETVTGEDAILLRFPSGGERYVYLDDRPHGERMRYSLVEVENLKSQLGAAEEQAADYKEQLEEAEDDATSAADERDEARASLEDAQDVIRRAERLLESIRWDEADGAVPDWIRDPVESALAALSD